MEDELQWLQDRLLTGAYPVGYGVRVALLPLFSLRQASSAPIGSDGQWWPTWL